ncbi:MAG: ras guanine nucleotide exchange factor domain-containing protein [Benjaminiella poitrasii]|nr:MAG: ras guanine nucleotide exchange factor domain-containing protein [Benjaminiella poitrasii]
MEAIHSSLATASLHFDNGQIKDAYSTFLMTAQSAIKPLFDVKFVHCSIVSKPQNSDDLISVLHSCVDYIDNIIKQHSAATKTGPPPLPPKPLHVVNKPVLPPKPTTTTSIPIHTSTTMVTRQRSVSNINDIIVNSQQQLMKPDQYQKTHPISQPHYNDNNETIPDGDIDPTHLVPAQTNSNDSLTPPNNSGTTAGGMKVDHVPHIPTPPLLTTHRVLQAKLDELESALKEFHTQRNQLSEDEGQMKNDLETAIAKYTPYVAEAKQTLNRVRTVYMSAATIPNILHFQPGLVAYQLTRIESAIFLAIPPHALLSHSPKTPHPRVVASSDFFNYVTRLIEHSILLPQEASSRAQHVNHWIKIASKCQELNNYQTLKAVVSALGTPPVQRLKRTWAYIPKKSLSRLEAMNDLMSEANNYGKYREHMGIVSTSVLNGKSVSLIQSEHYKRPTVPFLGTFIHDMTYLLAAVGQTKSTTTSAVVNNSMPIRTSSKQSSTYAVHSDPRINRLLETLEKFQATPRYDKKPSGVLSKIIMNKPQTRPGFTQALQRSKTSFGRLGGAIGLGSSGSNATDSTHNIGESMNSGNQPSCDYPEMFDMEAQQSLVTQYLLMRSWVSQTTVDELSVLREPPNSTNRYASGRTSSSMGSHYTSSIMSNASSLMRFSNNSPATSSTLTLASSLNGSRPGSLDDNDRSYIYGRESAHRSSQLTSSSTLEDEYEVTASPPNSVTSSDIALSPRENSFWNDSSLLSSYNNSKVLLETAPVVPPRPLNTISNTTTNTITHQHNSNFRSVSQRIAQEAIVSRQVV